MFIEYILKSTGLQQIWLGGRCIPPHLEINQKKVCSPSHVADGPEGLFLLREYQASQYDYE